MAAERELTALPQCESSKAIDILGVTQVDSPTTRSKVSEKRQRLSDLFTIVREGPSHSRASN